MQLFALLRLGFPSAPGLQSLNLATYSNSQAHSTKGTPSPLRALTACGSTVSGSISLPSRGAFHLSLTVLCAIGSYLVFSLGRWSSQIQTGFLVSRPTQVPYPCSQLCFAYGAFTLFGVPSQCTSATVADFLLHARLCTHAGKALQPPRRNGTHLGTTWF